MVFARTWLPEVVVAERRTCIWFEGVTPEAEPEDRRTTCSEEVLLRTWEEDEGVAVLRDADEAGVALLRTAEEEDPVLPVERRTWEALLEAGLPEAALPEERRTWEALPELLPEERLTWEEALPE